MSNPTLAEIIQDYRKKAIEFNIIADTLERDYKVKTHANGETSNGESVDIEAIKGILEKKNSARPAYLAGELNISKENINSAIDLHPQLFERAARGWVKLK